MVVEIGDHRDVAHRIPAEIPVPDIAIADFFLEELEVAGEDLADGEEGSFDFRLVEPGPEIAFFAGILGFVKRYEFPAPGR